MVIKTTRWSLDTCNCVIDCEVDDALKPEDRVLTYTNAVRTCSFHNGLLGTAKGLTAPADDNFRKNMVLKEALDAFDAKLSRDRESNVQYEWSFTGVDDARVLVVSFPDSTLTTLDKASLQTTLTTRFGAGKVTVT